MLTRLTAFLVWLLGANFACALEVVVISDLNGSYGSVKYDPRVSRAIQRIIDLQPDLVISTGDMVAGQRVPALTEGQVKAMWASFNKVVSTPLEVAGIPLVVTPGNHDASAYGGFKKERAIFASQWKSRKAPVNFLDEETYPFFYGFEMEGILFVSLDATTLGPLSGNQSQRLTKLSQGYKSIVTFSHLPLWPFAQKREREIIGDPAFGQLQQDVGVTVHLSGHHHAYYPGWKDGVAYISQACLGGGARTLIGDAQKSENSFTLLSIDAMGEFSVLALLAPDYKRELDITTLPNSIVTPEAVLQRLDLVK